VRRQQREERSLRQREDRALRRLPPRERPARQTDIRRAREQRARQRQQIETNAAAGAAVQSRTRRGRRAANASIRVSPQAARQGRFGAPFSAQRRTRADWRARHYRYTARRAWRRGLRAAFVPWYGPVFWPYAYADIFTYTFWPDGYEPGYWSYVYDDFIDGLFWGEFGPPVEYVYAEPYAGSVTSAPRVRYSAVQELCNEPGGGVTAWPFAEMERKLGLNEDQKRLLDDMRAAAKQASSVFKASCPAANAFPLTPLGRLRAMTARLDATLQAVHTVRPALEAFYASLSDEQKERFNEIGPKGQKNAELRQALPSDSKICSEAKPGLTNLPIAQIEASVKPDDAQGAALDRLEEATVKAVAILQAACPADTPLTPPGRLQVMETRLQAMIDAANTVKPALDDFYGQLSDEQKARFNRIGKAMASQN
jgi:hypothetical protein